MSNRHVRELEHVYRAIFADALYTFPTLEIEFERDLKRLLQFVEHRGIRVYLEYLPAVGKHLDRCLSNGKYIQGGLPLTKRVSPWVVVPKFLRGLYLLVFDELGFLKEDCSTESIFFLRQILYAAKKTDYDCTADKVEDAVQDFIDTDALLPEPDGFWNAVELEDLNLAHAYLGYSKHATFTDRLSSIEDPRRAQDAKLLLGTLDIVSSILTTTLGQYLPEEWRFRHGPGAISETTGPTNKYCWSNWSSILESEYPIADCGFHNYSSWVARCGEPTKDRRVESSTHRPSRLVAVPKTFDGPRLIAAEPSEHQWCQQNIWHYFCRRVRSTWITGFVDFNDQSRNQELCIVGSRDDSLATVDLSAASDRVTCLAVGQFFRSNPKLLRSLRACRTRVVSQTLVETLPENVTLRKFSTMGSACTFPVETLIFLGIALSAVLVTRRLRPTLGNIKSLMGEVAVFGDDVVIPVDSRELFVDALEVLYFKVNDHKSYWTGKFRESCGVDAFDGVNVTPIYWHRFYNGGPESLASVAGCRNNYYNKFLLHTAAYLASTLPPGIPEVAKRSGAFGLKTRCRPRNAGFKRRYNHDLQRVEIYVRSLLAKQSRSPTNDDTAILQYFTEAPDPLNKWVHGVPQRPLLKIKQRWVAEEELSARTVSP
jgi:hypothetical protein